MAMAAVPPKQKQAVFTLALEKGSSQRVVGEKFGVAKSTVADNWKDHAKISDSVSGSHLHTLNSIVLFTMPNLT